VADDPHFEDFTESGYRLVLREAKRRYRFEPFGTDCEEPHVLWRHDVDFSVHRAARLAAIEIEEEIRATYFFSLHSTFYNLLERGVADLARAIVGRDEHRLGLHFDSGFYDAVESVADLEEKVSGEVAFVSDLLGAPVESVSFHNPSLVHDYLSFDADEIAGLVNTYGRSLRERYSYVSDSNGYWRFRRLFDVVAEGSEKRLHVLTHPEWWQPEAMAPRERVVRCIEGRAMYTLNDYDDVLARAGRANVSEARSNEV
jgi:hypothetical protein